MTGECYRCCQTTLDCSQVSASLCGGRGRRLYALKGAGSGSLCCYFVHYGLSLATRVIFVDVTLLLEVAMFIGLGACRVISSSKTARTIVAHVVHPCPLRCDERAAILPHCSTRSMKRHSLQLGQVSLTSFFPLPELYCRLVVNESLSPQ